jgi:hypothetical protein
MTIDRPIGERLGHGAEFGFVARANVHIQIGWRRGGGLRAEFRNQRRSRRNSMSRNSYPLAQDQSLCIGRVGAERVPPDALILRKAAGPTPTGLVSLIVTSNSPAVRAESMHGRPGRDRNLKIDEDRLAQTIGDGTAVR